MTADQNSEENALNFDGINYINSRFPIDNPDLLINNTILEDNNSYEGYVHNRGSIKKVVFRRVNGLNYVDYDLVIPDGLIFKDETSARQHSGESRAVGYIHSDQYWESTIHYIIHDDLIHRKDLIVEALSRIGRDISVNFVFHSFDEYDLLAYYFKDSPRTFILFMKSGKGSFSLAGLYPPKFSPVVFVDDDSYLNQSISNINQNEEFVGAVMHEVCHILGLFHEHSRLDRDDYIDVKWENLRSYTLFNFDTVRINYEIVDPDNYRDIGPFDWDSNMLYGSYTNESFAVDPSKPVMTDIYGRTFSKKRGQLSAGDISALKQLIKYGDYEKPEGEVTEFSKSSIEGVVSDHDTTASIPVFFYINNKLKSVVLSNPSSGKFSISTEGWYNNAETSQVEVRVYSVINEMRLHIYFLDYDSSFSILYGAEFGALAYPDSFQEMSILGSKRF